MKPRVTSFAPQFLVDDLDRSSEYYKKLGFTFGETWGGFYAIGYLDGLELEARRTRVKRKATDLLQPDILSTSTLNALLNSFKIVSADLKSPGIE